MRFVSGKARFIFGKGKCAMVLSKGPAYRGNRPGASVCVLTRSYRSRIRVGVSCGGRGTSFVRGGVDTRHTRRLFKRS